MPGPARSKTVQCAIALGLRAPWALPRRQRLHDTCRDCVVGSPSWKSDRLRDLRQCDRAGVLGVAVAVQIER